MSDEIDEFIRRAAERRAQQGKGARRSDGRPAQSAPSGKSTERARPQSLPPQVIEAEVVQDALSPAGNRLDNRAFDARAAALGEETGLADEKLEAHLQHTFDHKLGRLGQSSSLTTPQATLRTATDTAAEVTTAASNEMLMFLVGALRSPQYVRQAIILSDILARPEHRW